MDRQLHLPLHLSACRGLCAETEGLLLMEFMRGGDLSSRMHALMPDGRGRVFAWENKGQQVALQVAVGLAYLHRQKIAHMDLKPRQVSMSRAATATFMSSSNSSSSKKKGGR